MRRMAWQGLRGHGRLPPGHRNAAALCPHPPWGLRPTRRVRWPPCRSGLTSPEGWARKSAQSTAKAPWGAGERPALAAPDWGGSTEGTRTRIRLCYIQFALALERLLCAQGSTPVEKTHEPESLFKENRLRGGGDSPAQRYTRKRGGWEKFTAAERERRGRVASCLRSSGRRRRGGSSGRFQSPDLFP